MIISVIFLEIVRCGNRSLTIGGVSDLPEQGTVSCESWLQLLLVKALGLQDN